MSSVLTIRLHEKADPNPAFPEFVDRNPTEGQFAGVAILEGGTAQGRTSLGFFVEIDGKLVFAQMTGRIFDMLAGAFYGACLRYGDDIKPPVLPASKLRKS